MIIPFDSSLHDKNETLFQKNNNQENTTSKTDGFKLEGGNIERRLLENRRVAPDIAQLERCIKGVTYTTIDNDCIGEAQ